MILRIFLLLTVLIINVVFSSNVITKDLEFIPTEMYDSLDYPKSNIWKTHKLQIMPFRNSIVNPNKIGEISIKNEFTELKTDTDLSVWLENVLKYSFQKNNISVVNDDPTIIFKGEILNFNISSTNILKGHISLRVKLLDGLNNTIYSGIVESEISRVCEYMGSVECFKISSDMIIEWIKNFLNKPEISEAVVKSYQNTVILHDFNYLHRNLVSDEDVPQKKPILKKLGTLVTCLGIAPIITGFINKSKGNDDVADPLFIIGSTATSAGLTTAGISIAFDIKYNSFQSRFRKKLRINQSNSLKELSLH